MGRRLVAYADGAHRRDGVVVAVRPVSQLVPVRVDAGHGPPALVPRCGLVRRVAYGRDGADGRGRHALGASCNPHLRRADGHGVVLGGLGGAGGDFARDGPLRVC